MFKKKANLSSQNGTKRCVFYLDVLNRAGCLKQLAVAEHEMSLLPHRDFSFFLQRRAASYNFAVNLVFLLIPFRLSQGQFYASHEASLAERDRRYAEQNTAEWTCFKVWEIWCCD